jgi:hypothetical protein
MLQITHELDEGISALVAAGNNSKDSLVVLTAQPHDLVHRTKPSAHNFCTQCSSADDNSPRTCPCKLEERLQ